MADRGVGAKAAGAQGPSLAIPGARFVDMSPTHPLCFTLLVGALLRLVGNAITGTVGGLQVQS